MHDACRNLGLLVVGPSCCPSLQSWMESASTLEQDVCNATIVHRHDLTAELSIVQIRPDHGVVPDFLPGQFVKLGLPRAEGPEPVSTAGRSRSGPRLVRRAYSIASSPRQRDALELLIVRVETGKLTPRLWTLEPGGRVWLDDKISGHFTLNPVPPGKNLIMVATGTGIAPYVSMLRTYAEAPPWRQAVVINGVRYAADLAYREELEALAAAHDHIVYIPITSREPEAPPHQPLAGRKHWTGLRGRVQQVLEPHAYEALVGASLNPCDCQVMLCGNPDMIVSVQRMLEERGFHVHSPAQPGNIHYERYW